MIGLCVYLVEESMKMYLQPEVRPFADCHRGHQQNRYRFVHSGYMGRMPARDQPFCMLEAGD